jgi:conjugative relaxase-like TrwC/TraI family protein
MLRINQQRSAKGAATYFDDALARDEYYSKDALLGRWGGKGAEQLGLGGTVEREQFIALCNNLNPFTGQSLTPRTKQGRSVGYDFTWNAPKSLSFLYGVTRDIRLLEAFETSVQRAMDTLEQDVRTRVRQHGQNAERVTGNLIYGMFTHLTSRPVDGITDPHLHSHCFVMNATHDLVEAKWKAAQFRTLLRDALRC